MPRSRKRPASSAPAYLACLAKIKFALEGNTSINMVTIGRDGKPAQKSLFAVLQEWVAFRFEIVTRRTAHRLSSLRRKHRAPLFQRRPRD